jgi:hypothetical protein
MSDVRDLSPHYGAIDSLRSFFDGLVMTSRRPVCISRPATPNTQGRSFELDQLRHPGNVNCLSLRDEVRMS